MAPASPSQSCSCPSPTSRRAWRIAFGISALRSSLLPRLARSLRETGRYIDLAKDGSARTRGVRRSRAYGFRFLLLGLAAFLTNFFSAPSAQLTNRFLTDEHGYSNTLIAAFRAVTAGIPGLLGIIIAGKLAETRGRRPVAIVGLVVATIFQMTFFLGDGAVVRGDVRDRRRQRRRNRAGRLRHRALPYRSARHVERAPPRVRGHRIGRRAPARDEPR